MNDTRTPVIAGVSTIALNILLCALLVGRYEAAGLALSLSLTTTIEGLILLTVLLYRLGGFDPGFGFWIFRALLPTAAMGLVCAVLVEPLTDVTIGGAAPLIAQLAMFAFALVLAGGTYLGVCLFTNVEECVEMFDRAMGIVNAVASRVPRQNPRR